MEGPFQGFVGQEFVAPHAATQFGDPTHFTQQMRDLLGPDFDPDSVFLEESWTIGLPTAIANWRRRQSTQADRERQHRAFQDFGGLHMISPLTPEESPAEILARDRNANIARHYSGDAVEHPDTPLDALTPRVHRYEQTREPVPQYDASPEESAEICEAVMTPPAARQLLGVLTTSTPGQIKSAYRTLVKQWHPDRLQATSEEGRRRAGEKMAALNQAYHLLCA